MGAMKNNVTEALDYVEDFLETFERGLAAGAAGPWWLAEFSEKTFYGFGDLFGAVVKRVYRWAGVREYALSLRHEVAPGVTAVIRVLRGEEKNPESEDGASLEAGAVIVSLFSREESPEGWLEEQSVRVVADGQPFLYILAFLEGLMYASKTVDVPEKRGVAG